MTEPPPAPAGLDRRTAEVTQALLEAFTCAPPGWYPTAADVARYATGPGTAAALARAAALGLAQAGPPPGDRWQPTARAEALRGALDAWFYSS
jgi:hypothetical protein